MRKLVVLGNGFDLACGVKSDYFSFLKSQVIKTGGKEYISENIDFFSYIFSNYFLKEDKSFKDECDKILKLNYGENWADLETFLKAILTSSTFLSKIISAFEDVSYFVSNLNNDILHDTFLRYFSSRINIVVNECSNKIPTNFLMVELNKFEKAFCNYVSTESNKRKIQTYKNALFKLLVGNEQSGKILTFNYTTPCTNQQFFKIYNVHGSCKKNNAIFGIDISNDNLSNDIFERLLPYSKTTRKMQISKNEDSDSVFDDNIDSIIFYGHSFGEQDYSYYQSIFDYYEIYDSKIKLIFCYSEFRKDNPGSQLVFQTKAINKLLKKYGASLDNKDHGKNLTHKLIIEGRLLLKEIKTKELDEEMKTFVE